MDHPLDSPVKRAILKACIIVEKANAITSTQLEKLQTKHHDELEDFELFRVTQVSWTQKKREDLVKLLYDKMWVEDETSTLTETSQGVIVAYYKAAKKEAQARAGRCTQHF